MKQTFIFILIFSFAVSYAQDGTIDNANKLIKKKKYESAFRVLNNADPTNDDPDLVIAKTDLVLDYFVSSIMHQLFALTDLEPDEEILDIRGSEGQFTMFAYAPDSLLNRLIDKFPDNYKLRKALGYYYHEVHLKYGQNWIESDSVVVKRFFDNYWMAYENGVFDYWSVYGIGYAYLMNEDYKSAIPYLEKSIELKKDYPSSHYNLAYAYLYTDQREKGIKSAKSAMDLYDYPQYKADAARMIAIIYRELENNEKAFEFYQKADKIEPNNYYTVKPLLELEILFNKKTYHDKTKQFFLLAPGNPTIYQDLMEIYWNYDKADELLDFLSSQHKNYLADNNVDANLYFYTAVIQYDKEDFENSEINFEKAREKFKEVYEPNHSVFDVIDSYTDGIHN